MTTDIIQPDYTERADKQKVLARKTLVQSGIEKYDQAVVKAVDGGKCLVESVRLMRAAGLDFINASERQLTFNEYGRAWFRSMEDWLPEKFTLEKMAFAVNVARRLPENPKTLEDCRGVIQLVLFAAEVFTPPKRIEEQVGHTRNMFTECISYTARLSELFEKAKAQEPMNLWHRDKLEQFVRNAKPIVEDVMAAEELLKHL